MRSNFPPQDHHMIPLANVILNFPTNTHSTPKLTLSLIFPLPQGVNEKIWGELRIHLGGVAT